MLFWAFSDEIRCQFIILARKDEPTADYARHRITRKDELTSHKKLGKGQEIRCQFINLARKDEPTPDFAGIP